MATAKLSRNLPANQNSLHKWTYSGWVKRCDLGAEIYMFNFYDDANNRGGFRFNTDDTLLYYDRVGGSTVCNKVTNRVFRDTAAWYHVMVAVDKSVSSPDTKIYVNGVEETSFSTDNDYSQNQSTKINDNDTLYINSYDGSSDIKSQIQTHVHWVSGYTLTPATFGETDSTSGIWKPKTAPSVTYGTNGFFLKFENSAAMGTDSSGNSNNFTVSGTLTQNVDTPTNNYATLTPLYTIEYNSSQFFTNGNNTTNSNTTQWNTNPCTMEVSSGKWYFEGYGHTNGSNYVHYGITSSEKMGANATQAQQEINAQSNGYSYAYYGYNGSIYYSTTSASSSASYGATYGSSDYIGIFADLDNNKLYFAKNGTLQNSGTGYSINADGKPYILATAVYSGLTNVNFGSGVFGTTALTGTTYADANGHGTFKYSPNQGGAANFDSAAKNFYAMNTKNLKEFG